MRVSVNVVVTNANIVIALMDDLTFMSNYYTFMRIISEILLNEQSFIVFN